MNASVKHGRSALLDVVRAIAILLVLIFHVATRYEVSELDAIGYFFLKYGFLGVDIFFPLSGYLITRFLLKEPYPGKIRTFFLRRCFRIMPLYFGLVAVYFVASLVTGIDKDIIGNIWTNLTFTTGWFVFFNGPEVTPYQITWSLSVEEFAYVILGCAAWIMFRSFQLIIVFLTIGPIILRFYLNSMGYDDVYFLPPARLDSIAIGSLLAIAMHRKLPAWQIFGAASVILYLVFSIYTPLRPTLHLTFLSCLTCMAIALFETRLKSVSFPGIGIFADIGFYSYFTYLFHFFAIYGVMLISSRLGFDIPFWGTVFASLVITHGLAVLSYAVFEGPLMKYGRSLERSP